ncbi:MAG: hypothetical protein GC179_30385 [Anaerolineaceae bacterium]|nr:hypothetical protein [Anaerolineaceae bacterium]
MARQTAGKRTLQIVMPEATYEGLQDYAMRLSTPEKSVFVSDIVRMALKEYFAPLHEDLDFDVDRGGYRGHKRKVAADSKQAEKK